MGNAFRPPVQCGGSGCQDFPLFTLTLQLEQGLDLPNFSVLIYEMVEGCGDSGHRRGASSAGWRRWWGAVKIADFSASVSTSVEWQ